MNGSVAWQANSRAPPSCQSVGGVAAVPQPRGSGVSQKGGGPQYWPQQAGWGKPCSALASTEVQAGSCWVEPLLQNDPVAMAARDLWSSGGGEAPAGGICQGNWQPQLGSALCPEALEACAASCDAHWGPGWVIHCTNVNGKMPPDVDAQGCHPLSTPLSPGHQPPGLSHLRSFYM